MRKSAAALLVLILLMAPAAYAGGGPISSPSLVEALSGWIHAAWEALVELLPSPHAGGDEAPPIEEDTGVPNAYPIITPTG